MSKKAKTKPEASPSPQSPSRDEEPARPNGTPAPQSDRGWGWLRAEDLESAEVEPPEAAKWDEATFDNARWP